MPHLSPNQRVLQARMAAHASWARTKDPAARTAPARDRFAKRFLDQVDPDRILPEAERLRRVEHAKRAYFTALALKSSKARARKAGRFHVAEDGVSVVDGDGIVGSGGLR